MGRDLGCMVSGISCRVPKLLFQSRTQNSATQRWRSTKEVVVPPS